MYQFSNPIVLCAGALILTRWLYGRIEERRFNPNRLPLPPGPKGYPLIGSLFNFPTHKAWLVYDDWFKIYGDMVFFEVLGQPFLILGSLERTADLFERRSSNYSDRPRMPMLVELFDGWDFSMALLPYGIWWRRHRRCFHDHFHPNIVHKYYPIQLSTARSFLRRLLESPEDFRQHTRHAFASTIMKITYGITIQEEDDPYVEIAEQVLSGLSEAGNPGSFLVDLIPAMKHIPSWFPGAQWKRKADRWRHTSRLFTEGPFELVKKQLKAGTAVPCVATIEIEKLPDEDAPNRAEEETIARDTCAIAFAGGADTAVSTVQSFFMAMCLYPEVQKKAQAELDTVCGGRLPEFTDKIYLPYVSAVAKEAMRWQLVVPLAIGHMCTNADEYDGYYIPKGTIVFGNSWTILHDPDVFDDPLSFNPDRYLKDGKLDPTIRDPNAAAFGYGRRICAGRFLSDNSLFSIIAHVLAVYDIKPGLDENGREVEIEPEVTGGMLSYPGPFSCRIVPRSQKAEELIRSSELMD